MKSVSCNYADIQPIQAIPAPESGLPKASMVTDAVAPAATERLSEVQLQTLMDQGYTRGLAESLNQTRDAFALRIWIIDNSGSMQQNDGHRIVGDYKGGKLRTVDCSRWDEIRDCVEYHVRLASLLKAPTRFRLLNDPNLGTSSSRFSIAENAIPPAHEVSDAISLLRRVRPGGCTPLTQHILEIHREITEMAPALYSVGRRVAVTIATDGLPTDERGYGGAQYQREFTDALRLLEGLPVWVVIRLCTDDDECVDFYNKLDDYLELSIDVLDDFKAEAQEVYDENPWLTYSLQIHRLREFGFHDRLFDLIDERRLSSSQVRDYCSLIFGRDAFDGVPDPNADWDSFSRRLARVSNASPDRPYNPMKNRNMEWVNLKRLNRLYAHKSCFFF